MINPWHKRANELIRDPLSLLPLVSPQPVEQFFGDNPSSLFDRLVIVVGSPGSGKTTLARLLEFETLMAALRASDRKAFRPLIKVLSDAGVAANLQPKVLAVRLPANVQYRAIWELPYSADIRHKLLRSLLQSRAVLGWIRHLESQRVDLTKVKIQTTGVGDAERTAMFADDPQQMRALARASELAVFKVLAALVPPAEVDLAAHVPTTVYDPLAALSSFVIPGPDGADGEVELRPMLIIDDAHELHERQIEDVDKWLRNRELQISRWIMTRVDSVSPSDFRRSLIAQEEEERPAAPGTTQERDRLFRPLQRRDGGRNRFRPIAVDISQRYLTQVSAFALSKATDLPAALNVGPASPKVADTVRLDNELTSLTRTLDLNPSVVNVLRSRVPRGKPEDVSLAIVRILMHREAQRTPQRSLFGGEVADDGLAPAVVNEPKVDNDLVQGAELQLLHQFGRPFYYGFERLADAANENIEQFVSMASVLVDELETMIMRGRGPQLNASLQHKTLVDRARKIMRDWDFPFVAQVRLIISMIVDRCTEITLRPNAPLGKGANAFGVPQDDLKALDSDSDLARVIHYALAYQAITLVEEYKCKDKVWCLFELGGIPCVASGLTLGRGGFVEGRLSDLQLALGA
jgi:hypothetical protein